MEYTKYQFEEVVTLFDKQRIPLSSMERAKRPGKYRYYGAQGIIDYIDDYIFDGEYLLLAEDGENLKSNKQDLAQLVDGKFWVNNHAHILRTKEVCRLRYFYYWINNKNMAEYVTGSAQPKLSQASLKKMIIHLPSLEIQDRILNVITPIDEKIKENTKINENLAQQAQAVFLHLFGNNDSLTPATIADVAINVTDGVHNTVHDDPEGEYLLLSCKNIKGGSLTVGSSERRISLDTFEKLRRRTKLAKGDVLISSVGTVGELLLLNTEPANYEFQRSVAMVKPNPAVVSPAYLYESLVSQKAELINAAHGAVQQCLFISDIAGFPIGVPTTEDLRTFDEIVVPMFDAITANEAESLRLATLRDTLLPRLMSGELDVSGLDI